MTHAPTIRTIREREYRTWNPKARETCLALLEKLQQDQKHQQWRVRYYRKRIRKKFLSKVEDHDPRTVKAIKKKISQENPWQDYLTLNEGMKYPMRILAQDLVSTERILLSYKNNKNKNKNKNLSAHQRRELRSLTCRISYHTRIVRELAQEARDRIIPLAKNLEKKLTGDNPANRFLRKNLKNVLYLHKPPTFSVYEKNNQSYDTRVHDRALLLENALWKYIGPHPVAARIPDPPKNPDPNSDDDLLPITQKS